MGVVIASFLWGFSEATLFFIVPDVLLTYVAVRSLKKSLYGVLFAISGALIGGSLLYYVGIGHHEEMINVLERIPAINGEIIERVENDLVESGPYAILVGPLSGTPYKIFATQSYDAGIDYFSFFMVSIPARGIRFVFSALASHLIFTTVLKRLRLKYKYLALTLFWIAFYGFYFTAMGW